MKPHYAAEADPYQMHKPRQYIIPCTGVGPGTPTGRRSLMRGLEFHLNPEGYLGLWQSQRKRGELPGEQNSVSKSMEVGKEPIVIDSQYDKHVSGQRHWQKQPRGPPMCVTFAVTCFLATL